MTLMSDAPIATLTDGAVRGSVADGVHRFLGIPYAAPPFGENRFREPQPPAPWDDVREATAFGPTSPQVPYAGPIGELLGSVIIDGDDVLTANVWAPAQAEQAPVVLWLHGGALERGTAAIPLYDGAVFARAGIVFVSVNYRLGSEGFSVLSDAPANLGLLDAAAALAWVHREVAAFGGDPTQITVMGESAGGALVAGLLALDTSRPMIARGIIQSGPLRAQPRKKAGRVTAQLAKLLGIPAEREAFAAVTPDQLLEARRTHAAGSSPLGGAPGFQFAIDAEALPRSPHDVLGESDVPLLIGSNTDEYRLWFTPEQLSRLTSWHLLLARLALRIPRRAIAAYRAAFPGASTGEIYGQVATDLLLRAPLTRAAASRPAPTYVYEFAWRSPVRDLRAAHALELGFVFDQLASADAQRMTGSDAPQHLADEMRDAWIAFITTGDPGWAPFGAERSTRVLDAQSATVPQRRTTGLDLLPD
ncbi:carboxylesterase/lipase family protein [Microbacterium esteraromaticum]|uniref:Carboxylic ester hydrolase n=2 Tax=Microbacterium esteraromaticum TaxID=57043 RepID=A0A939DWM3_9MICO|nr:carboxylesterase/lipase family protein [Microbacterium esteraromaticum]MBN8416507.1 carboxylesterase/lipase family protein [Microbacterium esteraromaticum]